MATFKESQRFPLWAEVLTVVSTVIVPVISLALDPKAKSMPGLFAIPFVGVLLYLLLFRMVTEVNGRELRVAFGWIPTYRRAFEWSEIQSATAKKYDPIREFGGWGIRGLPVSCLNARGNQGVLLSLKNGRTMMIGSQEPQKLLAAIREAARQKGTVIAEG